MRLRPSTRFVRAHQPPDELKWFQYHIVQAFGGEAKSQPTGKWCESCGTITEAFPLLEPDSLVDRCKADPNLNMLVSQCRDNLQKAACERSLPIAVVNTRWCSGLSVRTKLAFVAEEHLTKFFKTAIASIASKLGLALVDLPDSEGQITRGIIVKPAELPWTEVERLYTTESTISEFLLDRGDILREGQAGDTFEYIRAQQVEGRPAGTKKPGWVGAMLFSEVEQRLKDHSQAALEAQGLNAQNMLDNTARGATGRHGQRFEAWPADAAVVHSGAHRFRCGQRAGREGSRPWRRTRQAEAASSSVGTFARRVEALRGFLGRWRHDPCEAHALRVRHTGKRFGFAGGRRLAASLGGQVSPW